MASKVIVRKDVRVQVPLPALPAARERRNFGTDWQYRSHGRLATYPPQQVVDNALRLSDQGVLDRDSAAIHGVDAVASVDLYVGPKS